MESLDLDMELKYIWEQPFQKKEHIDTRNTIAIGEKLLVV